MKATKALFFIGVFFCATLSAFAGKADPYRGVYDILSRQDKGALEVPKEAPIFLFDTDTLGKLWEKYAEKPLPPNLEQYRNEPSILAGFSDRNTIFLALEKSIFFGNGYISIPGGDNDRLEMRRRPNGQFDMAVQEHNVVSIYVLAAPRAIP